MRDRLAVSIPYIVGHGSLPSMRGDIFTTSQRDNGKFLNPRCLVVE